MGIIAITGTILTIAPHLPEVDSLTEIKLQTPLRIYTSKGLLIGEFGDKKRTPINIETIPPHLKNAFLAAEDANFYSHNGISFRGLSRALFQAIAQTGVQTGGSTITQQVAKNYFLTPDRTIIRKIREMLLAVEMEKTLSKDKILELYLNKIFLGNRAYGVVAAAQVYYGKSLDELSLAQSAMLAGLPKAPSSANPVRNPERALERRDWILSRMLSLGHITQDEFEHAISSPLTAKKHGVEIESYAPYIAEMARQKVANLFGDDAVNDGLNVYTTIDARLQAKATSALKQGIESYDLRHGMRPFEAHLEEITPASKQMLFDATPTYGSLIPALVTKITEKSLTVELKDGEEVTLNWGDGLSDARPYINESAKGSRPKIASDVAVVGDLIRIQLVNDTYRLAQLPEAEGAIVSLNPLNGAIQALVGGYDFYKSKFNRVTQAKRQMGSNMKPFIYAAAISKNMNAASIINDAPIVFHDNKLENAWRPTNDGGRFLGPTRLRVALYRSRNLVSIRILKQIGIKYARSFVSRFGFSKGDLPHNLSLALGTASFSPLQAARAYSTFANQGFLIDPFLIEKITDTDGNILYEASPLVACNNCSIGKSEINTEPYSSIDTQLASSRPEQDINDKLAERIMTQEDAFIMDSMLRDVTKKGTGWRAGKATGRSDIGGKTGTTNGPTDTWFSGYHPELVTVVWVGFDDNRNMGSREYGGTAALPVWLDFMNFALKELPVSPLKVPEGITSILIDKETGQRALPGQSNTLFEYFKEGNAPKSQKKKVVESRVNIQDIF
ncbi:MAG: penicillin-binding protein 1A [Cellvibrionales bacterium]|nr:penicillin-binding protein 1A [Cellvibrionales bacterium]